MLSTKVVVMDFFIRLRMDPQPVKSALYVRIATVKSGLAFFNLLKCKLKKASINKKYLTRKNKRLKYKVSLLKL